MVQKLNRKFHASPDMKFDLPIVFKKIMGVQNKEKNQNW